MLADKRKGAASCIVKAILVNPASAKNYIALLCAPFGSEGCELPVKIKTGVLRT